MPISKEQRNSILDVRFSTQRIIKANSFDSMVDFLLGEVDSLTRLVEVQTGLITSNEAHYQSLLKLEDALASVGYRPRAYVVG